MDANDLAHLEKLGYEGVLSEMAKGDGRLGRPGSQVREEIEHWLKLEQAKRESASSSKRDAREEETLAIAKEANSIARSAAANSRRANIIAISAIVFATITAIIAVIIGVKLGR